MNQVMKLMCFFHNQNKLYDNEYWIAFFPIQKYISVEIILLPLHCVMQYQLF